MVTRPRNLPQADPYFDSVVLLCPLSGEHGDTTTTDLSNEGHTMTFAANASLDANIRKFGFTSCLIDDTDGKGVYTPTSAAWANLKIADGFTVEAHVNYSVTGTNTLVSMWSWTQGSTTRSWGIFLGSDGGVDIWTQNSASSATHSFGSATGLLSADTWHHVVFQCQPAGNFEVFVDGTRVVNVAPTISELRDPTDDFCIGATDDSVDELDGYVENVRITKGVARYTDGFTPPERAYPTVQNNNGDPYFSSVVLLLPLDGADAATSATDQSNESHTPTFNANAQLDTAQFKFGTASALFDGTGDYISLPNATSLQAGSSSMTIECHVRFNGDPTTDQHTFVGKWNNNTISNQKEWWVGYRNNKLNAFISNNGSSGIFLLDVTWDPAGDTWYHIAFVFDRELATNETRVYVDGTQVGASDTTLNTYSSFFASSSEVWVGGYDDDTNDWMDGWIDNVRITKGVVRYSDSFTPPSGPYPAS